MVGALMALRTPYFSAEQSFDPMMSVTVIAMAVLGGGERVLSEAWISDQHRQELAA